MTRIPDFLQHLTQRVEQDGLIADILPYDTPQTSIAYNHMVDAFGEDGEAWPVEAPHFLVNDPRTVWLEATDEADRVAQALAAYWQAYHERPFAERWEAARYLPYDAFVLWTRLLDAVLPDKPESDQPGDDDPEATGAGEDG